MNRTITVAGSLSRVIETVVNILTSEGIKKQGIDSNISVRYEKGWCTDKKLEKSLQMYCQM